MRRPPPQRDPATLPFFFGHGIAATALLPPQPPPKILSYDYRLSKYHSQKPESTRRTIFNRDSTLQLIVQILSGNDNSSVRARAKTHGRTPVSIELPRGRHLGSNACIS